MLAGELMERQVRERDGHMQFTPGQRIRVPGQDAFRELHGAMASADGSWLLFLDGPSGLEKVELIAAKAAAVDILDTDGGADSAMVLAGLWAEWMRRAAATSQRVGAGNGSIASISASGVGRVRGDASADGAAVPAG